MKKIFLLMVFALTINCNAQTYSLKSHTETPDNAYLKDIDNDLPDYEGIWKGEWAGKIINITFTKLTHKYINSLNQFYDLLIGRFKVTNANGNILFDNTSLSDSEVKIEGMRFRKIDGKYSMIYIDKDLCGRSGKILINFTDTTKTKLQWKYMQNENWISKDCFYHGWAPVDIPQPLPNDIILIKQ